MSRARAALSAACSSARARRRLATWRAATSVKAVNFFGHAWVAGWFSGREPFILGAMLPDLANVLRAAPPAARHAELDAGIRLHHETDRVFHDSQVFRALERRSSSELRSAGLPKGPRRALAHIGVELLIDAELAARAPEWLGYSRALRYGATVPCGERLEWAAEGTGQRFASLCARLASVAPSAADTPRIAQRLAAALAGRPRVALQPGDVPLVERWLDACRPEVAASISALLAELAGALGASPAALEA